MKKILSLSIVFCLLFSLIGCTSKETTEAPKNTTLILSTTTSTQDSGLLDYILPDFTNKTGIQVKTISVGTGKAIQMGVDGEADVLLVHSKSDEENFVAQGHGLKRYPVMYNDFVIVGPKEDPANLKSTNNDILKGFSQIVESESSFLSRGDDSGTHKKELAIWKSLGITPKGSFYIEAGKGMGELLTMADEVQGYTLTDRATYLSMMDNLDLEILIEGDPNLINEYGVIPVNPDKNDKINNEGAMEFVNWITSEETQALIKSFGVEKYGQSLFFPNA